MRAEKSILSKQLKETLNQSDYFFVISYSHINSKKQNEVKNLLREKNCALQVWKNSIIKKAVQETDFSQLSENNLKNNLAIVFGKGEPVETAKIIKKFNKDNKEISFQYAFIDGQFLIGKEIKQVADLPTKEIAQSQFLGLLQAIPQKFVYLLNAVPSGIVNLLSAKKNSMEDK